jgi:hypothetical protein
LATRGWVEQVASKSKISTIISSKRQHDECWLKKLFRLGSAVPVHFAADEQDGSPTQQRRDAPMLNRFVGLTLAAIAAFGAAATTAAPAFALYAYPPPPPHKEPMPKGNHGVYFHKIR